MSNSTAAATGCIIFLFYSRGHWWSSFFYLPLPNSLNPYETRLCLGATNSANSPTYRRIPLTAQHASQFRVAAAWFEGLLNITLPLGSTMTVNITPRKADSRKFSGSWRFTNTGNSRKHSMAKQPLVCSELFFSPAGSKIPGKVKQNKQSSRLSQLHAAPFL